MKFTEFTIEFTKALKNKDNIRVLELIIENPARAKTCVQQNYSIRTLFQDVFLKNNPYVRTIFVEQDAEESISCAPSIVHGTLRERVLNIVTPRKELAHPSVDYFHKRKGIIQAKNVTGWDMDKDLEARDKYKLTVHELEIIARKTEVENTSQTRPKINIHRANELNPINRQELVYLLKEIDKKKSEIDEMITKVDPLLEMHKAFFDNAKNKGIDLLEKNPKFNHKNQQKNEFDLSFHKFKMTPDIKF